MDKLLPHRVNETETEKHRRAFEKNAESDNLEAMENGKEKGMGITETRSAEMDCPQGSQLGKSLPVCCHEIRIIKSSFQRKTGAVKKLSFFTAPFCF